MYTLIQSEQLELRPGGTLKFEGDAYAVAASFFHVKSEPGMGSTLHQHPYPEVWIVRAGTGRFTVGEETIVAGPGQVVVAAANVPHKYLNVGGERLEIIGIHPSPRVIQQELDEI
jgi:mannose-6-phosphate isomerase-like protein (cupin superfamily)